MRRWDPSRTGNSNTSSDTSPLSEIARPMKADQFRSLVLDFIGKNGSIKPCDYDRLEELTNLSVNQIKGRLSDMLDKKMIESKHIRDPRIQSLIALHINHAQENCGISFLSPLKDYLKGFIDEEIDYLQLRIAVMENISKSVTEISGKSVSPLVKKEHPINLLKKEDPPIHSHNSIARDIENWLQKFIGIGQIRNRKHVIDKLLEVGSISREGSDFLCVRAEGDIESVRLQGVIFSRDFDLDRMDN